MMPGVPGAGAGAMLASCSVLPSRDAATTNRPMPPTITTFCAAKSTYVVAALLCVVPFGVGLIAIGTRPTEPSSWGMAALAAVYGTMIFLWVRKFRIQIGDGKIRYQSLFGGSREVLVTDIESVRREGPVGELAGRSRPPTSLVLVIRDGRGASGAVTINLKVFRLSDVATLMHLVERHD